MNRLLLIITLVVSSVFAQAQDKKNIKTKVLVVGDGEVAVGAALQAAISGVKTTLITSEKDFNIALSPAEFKNGLGIEFLKRIRKAKGIKDSTAEINVDRATASAVFKTWADSTRNLEVIANLGWTKFERSGNGWSLKLDDGRSVKAQVLIYATKKNLGEKVLYSRNNSVTALDYAVNAYRTSVSGEAYNNKPSFTSMYSLLKDTEENLVIANSDEADLATGQAAGATAAYGAYFGIKTSLANLKIIQGELLKYKSALLPFADVMPVDTNWQAMQKVGMTGILKAEIKDGQAWFKPEQAVTYAEIKQPVKDLYYKAQIWFDDHVNVPITLETTIDMMSYVGNKSPESTKTEIEKRWKTGYKFLSNYDLKKVLTRREFSVLINDYLSPFNVAVDKTGRVIR